MKKFLTVLPLLCLTFGYLPAVAQQAVEEVEEVESVDVAAATGSQFESDNWPVVDRGINVLKPATQRKHSLLFLVEHRTRQKFDRESFQDLAGFDAGGLKIGLGLRYGWTDKFETGVYRLNGTNEIFDTYEFDVKYHLLNQRQHGIDLAARAGASWFSQGKVEDAGGYFGQLLLGGRVNEHLRLGTGLLAHSESSSELKTLQDEEHSVAVPVQLEVRFNGRVAWEFEAVTPVAGFKAPHPVISSSVKVFTWRHTFNLVVSNSQYMSSDGIVAGSHRSWDKVVVGFCITREFNL